MSRQSITLTKKNDQYILVPKLRVSDTQAYLNAATVTATLYDRTNAALYKAGTGSPQGVTGCTNVTGQYDSGGTGNYKIPIDEATFDPPKGGGYLLVIKASSAGSDLEMTVDVTVDFRGN